MIRLITTFRRRSDFNSTMYSFQFVLLYGIVIIAICSVLLSKTWISFVPLPIPPSLALLAAIYIFYDLSWKRRFLPPGPAPWLFFGNILHFMFYKSIDDMFLTWKRKYGNLVTFWIGPIPLVMVTDVETMHEYFVRNAEIFSNRWRNYATDFFMGGANGIIQIDGNKWKQQRRFVLRVLRDFGVGRILIEQQIMKEVEFFIDYLEPKCTGQEMDICAMHAVCVGNIINNILFGYRFPQGSVEFSFLHSLLDSQSRLVMHPLMGLYITLPLTTRIPFVNYKWKQFKGLRDKLWKFLSREVQIHMKAFNCEESPEITDFTYAYLSEMNRRKKVGEPNEYFSEWQLTMLLLDLFFAGMETTVTTLKWGFLLSVIHPEVQTKVQNELDDIGSRITLADKPKCSYTMATIHEIQRFANILPINLLRTVAEDFVMGKYYYPAGTLCIPQISIAMNDPTNFEKPKEFRPERFLEDDGFTLKKYDAFFPFSIGKRQCLGESLAKAELFLIYANLMRHFRFRTVPNKPNPSTKRLFGLTTSPPPYKCLVERRIV
ncbi:cytochrome P450 family protein [Loa loa]|uniref:Cytochrome P450 family protein n=1 Tax=Loa loa TaxID=7209 RepID=A0A1S0U3A2_LOALO|nr:cytochrome P450 family protein [Loa loa]EFO24453.1 cytochrome P450 family protein [Loa loa]